VLSWWVKKPSEREKFRPIEPLSEGAVKVTVAEYLTPNKTALNKVGLAPDVQVTATDDAKLLEASLEVFK